MEAISLSVHPNDTQPYIELNHEPKNLNQTSYQVVAHIYVGREGDPYPTHTHELHIILDFCVVDALPVLVNLFYLITLFDTYAHKKNNTTTPDMQCTKMQNKHELLIMVQSVLYLNKQQSSEN